MHIVIRHRNRVDNAVELSGDGVSILCIKYAGYVYFDAGIKSHVDADSIRPDHEPFPSEMSIRVTYNDFFSYRVQEQARTVYAGFE